MVKNLLFLLKYCNMRFTDKELFDVGRAYMQSTSYHTCHEIKGDMNKSSSVVLLLHS